MLKFIAISAAIITSNAFAIVPYIGPVLIKTTNTGYVAPGYNTFTKCELYNNSMFSSKIVLTYSAGNIQSEITKEVKITGDLAKSISDSQRGPFLREMAPVDGPGVVYTARKANPNGSYQDIILLNDNGGDGNRVTNNSIEAISLRNFLDLNCK
ncbi:hypothetical protein GCL60_02460 [Silvanigrella paludirubra]|uniref:Uncharacterized protein n=1 Tax=Silvanigrella paludirubra TaxID=2499159 RepID=A0A6N6VW19_9BACT|nr:hypothetical protein [Silvanigrella paludirubra]KAB8040810.1 hypothetical protein GCL60_02460 [Silvanigrella paludirubra]